MKITKDAIKALILNKYTILEQTEAVCLEAVRRNGYALKYVMVNMGTKGKKKMKEKKTKLNLLKCRVGDTVETMKNCKKTLFLSILVLCSGNSFSQTNSNSYSFKQVFASIGISAMNTNTIDSVSFNVNTYKHRDRTEDFFKGEHALVDLTFKPHLDSFSHFVVIDGNNVKIVWEDNDGLQRFLTLPLDKVAFNFTRDGYHASVVFTKIKKFAINDLEDYGDSIQEAVITVNFTYVNIPRNKQ